MSHHISMPAILGAARGLACESRDYCITLVPGLIATMPCHSAVLGFPAGLPSLPQLLSTALGSRLIPGEDLSPIGPAARLPSCCL